MKGMSVSSLGVWAYTTSCAFDGQGQQRRFGEGAGTRAFQAFHPRLQHHQAHLAWLIRVRPAGAKEDDRRHLCHKSCEEASLGGEEPNVRFVVALPPRLLIHTICMRRNFIANERNILAFTNNPFVVKLYYSFQSANNLYMVMEFLPGGDCFSLLRNLTCFPEVPRSKLRAGVEPALIAIGS